MREMLRLNVRDGVEYQYFSITYDGKTWTAWYNKILDVRFKPVGKTIEKVETDGATRK